MSNTKKIVKIGPPRTPPMLPFQLTIVFMDGDKPVASAPLQGQVPLPPPGQGAALEVRLDARQVLAQLEAQLGPAVSTLWKPGLSRFPM